MLIDSDVSHEKYTTIINEEEKYTRMKEILEWWQVKEVMLEKINRLEKVNELDSTK